MATIKTNDQISFPNGVTIDIKKEGDTFCGLGAVTIDGRPMRSDRMGILPYIETPDGYVAAEYILCAVDKKEGAVHLVLKPRWVTMGFMRWMQHAYHPRVHTADWNGVPQVDDDSRLEIILKPVHENLGGLLCAGFSYQYAFSSSQKKIHTLLDRATWEPGGSALGTTMYQRSSSIESCVQFAKDKSYHSGWILPGIRNPYVFSLLPLFTHLQGFTFQCDDRGYLITLYEHPMYIRSYFEKTAGAEAVSHFNQFGFDLTNAVVLPAQKIVYCHRPAVSDRSVRDNDFLAVREEVTQRLNDYYRVKRQWAMPWGQMFSWNQKPAVGKFLTYGVERLARLNIRQVFLLTLWETDMSEELVPEGNCCCILDFKIAKKFGGDEFLKKLTTAMHEKGMLAGMWTGHCFSGRSEHVRTHPQWFVTDMTGQIDRDHYGFAQAVFNEGNPEFRAWFLDRLKYAHDELGLDGLYRDSHFNQGTDKFNYEPAVITGPGSGGATLDNADALKRSADAVGESAITTVHDAEITLIRELQEMGYYYKVESSGAFGVIWCGLNFPLVHGNEHYYANTTRPFPIDDILNMGLDPAEIYFRGLANRICYGVCYNPDHGEQGTLFCHEEDHRSKPIEEYAGLEAAIARYNKVFMNVEADMKLQQLLPDCKGMVWANRENSDRIVWTYEACAVALKAGEKVQSVEDGTPIIVDGTLKAQKLGVYRLICS